MSTSTSLVVAACKGHTEVVTALVEHPTTDVNATVSGGWTALMWAAWWGVLGSFSLISFLGTAT